MNKEVKELIEEYKDISKTDRPKIAPYHGDMFIDVEMEYLMRKELQSRIDKAIEYIKENGIWLDVEDIRKGLIKILKGGSNE